MAVKTSWNAGDVLTAADLTDTFAAKAALAGATYTGTHDFTSATVTGISSGGLVLVTSQSFTTASAVNVNSCFTSTYDYYRVLVVAASSAANAALRLRMRLSGTDATTNYDYQQLVGNNTAVSAALNSSQGQAEIGGMNTSQTTVSLDIHNPALAAATLYSSHGWDGRGMVRLYGGRHTTATAYDGFSIYGDTGTITGTVKVYGYKNS
jgi:hypothetical protein